MTIKKLPEGLQKAINNCPLIIGIGPSAWPRVISGYYFPKFKILCYTNCQDNDYIRSAGIDVFSIQDQDPYAEVVPVTPGRIISSPIAKKFLSEQEKPFTLLVYKSMGILEKVCEKNGWTFIGNKMEVRDQYEDKRIFKEILREIGIEAIPGGNIPIEDLTKEKFVYFQKKLGQKKLVLQIAEATWGGGSGTLFLDSSDNLHLFHERVKELRETLEGKKKKMETVNIAPFIEGVSASIPCCTTKYGVLTGSIQTQIVDIKEVGAKLTTRSGVFAGHDWCFAKYSDDSQKQASSMAERFGDYLYKHGYKGIFGLDLIVEPSGKVWLVECNPRETDAFPLICMLQMEKGAVPMQVLHNLEHLGVEYDFNFNETNKSYKERYSAGQILLNNKLDRHIVDRNTIKAGVYRLKDHKLDFIRPGFAIWDLENEDEFLFTEDIPKKPGNTFMPRERMIRLIKRGKVLESISEITDQLKEVVDLIYKELKLVPIENGLINEAGFNSLFTKKYKEMQESPDLSKADVIDIVKRLQSGFWRPLEVAWRKKLSSDPILSQIRSKRAKKQIASDLKKLASLGLTIKVLPELDRETFNRWHDLYAKMISAKEKGQVIIQKDWFDEKQKKGKKVGAVVAFRGSNLIGGDLFFEVNGILTVGYGIAERVNKLVGGLALLLDYHFLDYAKEKGYKEISFGQDTNLYGADLSSGLFLYKSKLGFTPQPANKTYWVTTYFRSFEKFSDPILFFTTSNQMEPRNPYGFLTGEDNLTLNVIHENPDFDKNQIILPEGVKDVEFYSRSDIIKAHKELLISKNGNTREPE